MLDPQQLDRGGLAGRDVARGVDLAVRAPPQDDIELVVADGLAGVPAGRRVLGALEIGTQLVEQCGALRGDPGRALELLDRVQRDPALVAAGQVREHVRGLDVDRTDQVRARPEHAIRGEHAGIGKSAEDQRQRDRGVAQHPDHQHRATRRDLAATDEVHPEHDQQRRDRERAVVQHGDVGVDRRHHAEHEDRARGVAARIAKRLVEAEAHHHAEHDHSDERDGHGPIAGQERERAQSADARDPADANERAGAVDLLVAHGLGGGGDRGR